MPMRKILFTLFMLTALPAFAGSVEIEKPWSRATSTGMKNGAGFLIIHNHGEADKLIAAQANVSKAVELHTHIKDGDVMRMRKVEAIEIPKHGTVKLEPGSLHLMFIDLNQPLNKGDVIPVTLVFEKAGKVEAKITVEANAAMPAKQEQHNMHKGH